MTTLKFIAIKCKNLEESKAFYQNMVGLSFVKEKHGNGPEYYAAELKGGIVFELYPIDEDECSASIADKTPTFGFDIEHDINSEFEGVFLLDPDYNNNRLRRVK